MSKIKSKHLKEAAKTLGRYAEEHRRTLIWLTILSIISGIGNAVVPFLAGRLFDSILDPQPVAFGTLTTISLPWVLLSVWGLIQMTTYFIDWRIDVASMKLGARVFFDYFSRGFGHLLELPLSFHKSQKIGEIANKINMAANNLESLLGNVLISLAPQFLSIGVAIVIAFWIQPLLALVLISGVALYVFTVTRVVKPIAGLWRKIHHTFNRTFGDAYDAVFNAQPIKQAAGESIEQTKMYQKFSVTNYTLWTKLHATWAHLTFFNELLSLSPS